MHTISITLNLLKNPFKCMPYLALVMCFSVMYIYSVNLSVGRELLSFSFIHTASVIIFPELATTLIIIVLIHSYHAIFKITTLALSPKGIVLYQLKMMPIFLVAYYFFFPITFSVRHLIHNLFGSFIGQYQSRFGHGLTTETYFLYLPSVMILGYMLVNVSLIKDYFGQLANYTLDTNTNVIIKEEVKNIGLKNEDTEKERKHLNVLKVRGSMGESFLNAEDCLYFEASDHCTIVYHAEGTFKINLSLSKLENQLDPAIFFKNNPRYIINLAYLDSYKYLNKGQYVLNFKKPLTITLNTPKSRIGSLKMAFQNYQELKPTALPTSNKPLLALSVAD